MKQKYQKQNKQYLVKTKTKFNWESGTHFILPDRNSNHSDLDARTNNQVFAASLKACRVGYVVCISALTEEALLGAQCSDANKIMLCLQSDSVALDEPGFGHN